MKKSLFFFMVLTLISCSREVIRTEVCVIPQPASVQVYEGEFQAGGASISGAEAFGEYALAAVSEFEENLVSASGLKSGESGTKIKFIRNNGLEEEEYRIDVCGNVAKIRASALRGLLYSIETLKQMLPVEIYTGLQAAGESWTLPYMKIEDSPRFGYRGMHLDVARHFFDVAEVKRYLDIMAIHKLNIFHWHLSDDQGWRIEIKKYPELTQIGSVRKETLVGRHGASNTYDGIPYGEGCWFTQEQIREVIEYAASKGIEVIPEIDLPGHMQAALATYPELGCTGGPYEVWGNWGVSKDVLCVGKESTMTFLEDVLSEVADLFPSEYIHIGGDECPKLSWEQCPACQAKIAELGLKDDDKHSAEHYLQSYVTKRMESFLSTKGKRIIGWDEILEGELAPNATVMSWRGVNGGLEAAKKGHDAIMVPFSHLYLDYCQAKDQSTEPLGIGGYTPVTKVYSFEPYAAEMTDQEKSHIIGVQANLWTEYISDPAHLEYMLLPRLSAVSEVQWCQPESKNYERFLSEMNHMEKIYQILSYNYARHIFDGRE